MSISLLSSEWVKPTPVLSIPGHCFQRSLPPVLIRTPLTSGRWDVYCTKWRLGGPPSSPLAYLRSVVLEMGSPQTNLVNG